MRIRQFIMAMVCILSIFMTGCANIAFNTSFDKYVIASGAGTRLMQDECNLLLMQYQTSYNLYYEKMGSTDFWEDAVGDGDFSDYLRDGRFRDELCMLILLNDMASALSVALSEEEVLQCSLAAQEYYKGLSEAEIRFFQGDEETAASVYRKYRIAQKVIEALSVGAVEEISDNDKRVLILQIIAADSAAIQQAKARIDNGEDFEKIAKEYSRLSQIEYQVSRGKLNPILEKQAFLMRDGEISDVIRTEEGYYLIKCIDDFDEQLSERNDASMLEYQRYQIWKSSFSEYADRHSVAFSEEIWKQLKFQYTTAMKQDNLFTVYEAYFQ